MILAGDVGGTKVHLALYDFTGGQLHALRDKKFPADEFASLDNVVNTFLVGDETAPATKKKEILAPCFRLPGPGPEGRLQLTQLPLTPPLPDLAKSLSIPP